MFMTNLLNYVVIVTMLQLLLLFLHPETAYIAQQFSVLLKVRPFPVSFRFF